MEKTAFIFGITGQDGALLAKFLLDKSYRVVGATRNLEKRHLNLEILQIQDRICLVSYTSLQDIPELLSTYQPQEIYHLSAQSSVGLSFQQPLAAFESIVPPAITILEAVRTIGLPAKCFHAGSSECFGDSGDSAVTEETPFSPQSPYAVAKVSAHFQVASYRDLFGIFACTGFLYNHESFLRPREFVTQKIVTTACDIARGKADLLTMGNLSIQRDWGWAPEYVEAMWLMLQQDQPEDYIIATGKTMSLETFVSEVFERLGLDWKTYTRQDARFFRSSDVPTHRANPGKAKERLGWQARLDGRDVARKMVEAQLAMDGIH